MFRLAALCLLALAVVCAADVSSSTGAAEFVSPSLSESSSSSAHLNPSPSASSAVASSSTAAGVLSSSSGPGPVVSLSSTGVAAVLTSSSGATGNISVASSVSGAPANTSTGSFKNATGASQSSSGHQYFSTAAPVLPVTSMVGFSAMNVSSGVESAVINAIGLLYHAVDQDVTGRVALFAVSQPNITLNYYNVSRLSSYSYEIDVITFKNQTTTNTVVSYNVTTFFNVTTNTTQTLNSTVYTFVNVTKEVAEHNKTTFTQYTLRVLITLTSISPSFAITAANAIKSSVIVRFPQQLNAFNVTLGLDSFVCDSSAGFSVACPSSGFAPISVPYSSSTGVARGSTAVQYSTAPSGPTNFDLVLALEVKFNSSDKLDQVKGYIPQVFNALSFTPAGCTVKPPSYSVDAVNLKIVVIETMTCVDAAASKGAANLLRTTILTNPQVAGYLPGLGASINGFYCGSEGRDFSTVCPNDGYLPYLFPPSSHKDDDGLSKNAKIGIGVGVGGGGLLIIIIILSCCCCCKGDKGSSSGAGTEMMGAA